MKHRLFLCPPPPDSEELKFVRATVESNYIAPRGPMVDAFEKEDGAFVGIPHCFTLAVALRHRT